MSTTDLGFNVFALDKASKTFLSLAANVDRLSRKLDELDRKRANPKVDVDTTRAMFQLKRLEDRLDKLARGKFVANVAMAAAPLAIPAAAGALAGGGGALAVGGAAVAGLVGFAAVATAQLKIIKETLKKADELEADGHAKEAAIVMRSLSKAQIGVANSLNKLKLAWADFLATGGGASVLTPMAEGMGAIAQALPAVGRFLAPVSKAFGAMFDIIGDDMASKGFRKFSATLGEFAAMVTAQGIGATMNLARAFGSLIVAFMPLGTSMSAGLVTLTDQFADWAATVGKSDGFRKFIDYAKQTGPQLVSTLTAIGSALVSVGKALAPLAGVMLKGLEIFAKWLAKTAEAHPGVIQIAGAIGVAAAAFSAFAKPAAAVVGLFSALGSGPVGIAIGVIIAVGVAMAIAYKKSEAFRNIVKSVVGWVRDDLFPALVKLRDAALKGLADAWDNVKTGAGNNRPILAALGELFKRLGTVLVKNVIPAMSWWVTHVWPALGKAIGFGITVTKLITLKFLAMVEVGTMALNLLWKGATQAFANILKAAAFGLGWIPKIGPRIKVAEAAFDRFRESTSNSLDRIADAAGRMREELNRPANIEVHTDQATGAITRFITTAKSKFRDLGNDTYAIMVNGTSGHGRIFADGGWTGPGSRMQPAGVVHADEFVVSKAARGKFERNNPGALDHINNTGSLPGFDAGGRVGNVDVRANMSGAMRGVNALIKALKSMGGSVPATLAWAKRQVGKPYVWGGVGPSGYDCSGFMSAITNHLLGRNPFSRLFATGSFPTGMFGRGRGLFSIGSFRGNPGHMAGTLGGVNVESSGGVGVRVGKGARGASDPLFGGNIWHLKPGLIKRMITGGGADSAFLGRGGAFSPAERFLVMHESGNRVTANNPTSSAFGLGQLLSANRVKYAKRLGLNWHREAGDTGTTDRGAQTAMFRGYVHDRYGSAPNAMRFWQHNGFYDGGGILKPGLTLARNDSGKSELVLTNREAKALAKAFNLAKGMSGKDTRHEFNELLKGLRDNLGANAPLVKRIERMADVTVLSMKKSSELRQAFERARGDLQKSRGNLSNMQSSASSFYGGALFGQGEGLSAFGNAKQLAAGAKAFERNLRRLDHKGLSDSLLGQIASSSDFDSAAELAKLSPQALRRLNRLNKARMSAAKSVGVFAGKAVFGDDVRDAEQRVGRVRRAMEHRERKLEKRERVTERLIADRRDADHIGRAVAKHLHGARLVLRDGGRDREADLLIRTGI